MPKKAVKKSATRPSSVKKPRGTSAAPSRALQGKPAGFEVVIKEKVNIQTLTSSIFPRNEDIESYHQTTGDQDITPFSKDRKMETFDEEGNKYLNYKAISGSDCMPRIR